MLTKWWAHPEIFCRDVLGVTLWDKQLEILRLLREHDQVGVASCHGAGKSFTAAVAAILYLYTHAPSIVITTATTDRQVRGIIWREIRSFHRKAKETLGGQILQQELRINEDWFAWGFTAPDYDPDRFQGFHAPNMLVIADEASGISEDVHEGILGLLSSEGAKFLAIGNPTNPSGFFARMFAPGSRAGRLNVSSFDTPNFREFGITESDIVEKTWEQKISGPMPAPGLSTPAWVADRVHDWGSSNPLYVAKVLGRFPSADADSLFPAEWIEAAQYRELEPGDPVELGVDVARSGKNFTVIGCRWGDVYRRLARINGADTMEVSGRVLRCMEETNATIAKIDAVGIGAGVFDRLKELGVEVAEMNAGKPAKSKDQYTNSRAEWLWSLRARMERGELDIDPEDYDLAGQLAAHRWDGKVDSRGRIAIESKDEMAKRGVPSPDDCDACVLAFARTHRDRAPLVPLDFSAGRRESPWEF